MNGPYCCNALVLSLLCVTQYTCTLSLRSFVFTTWLWRRNTKHNTKRKLFSLHLTSSRIFFLYELLCVARCCWLLHTQCGRVDFSQLPEEEWLSHTIPDLWWYALNALSLCLLNTRFFLVHAGAHTFHFIYSISAYSFLTLHNINGFFYNLRLSLARPSPVSCSTQGEIIS